MASTPNKVNILANIQSDSKSGSVGEKSLKSQRTYQVGVVYKDIYGRETPVFTSGSGSFTVPKDLSDKRNGIITNLQNEAPAWVDTFKFFVKETSNEYYNACMDRWYDAEDDNLWLSFPSAERNKIKEDGFIILKKQAASDDAVHEEARYKVIVIKNEAPTDIKTSYESYGEDTITVLQNGALPGSKTIKLDFTGSATDWNSSVFYDAILVGVDGDESASPKIKPRSGITDTGFIGWPLEDVVVKLSNNVNVTTGWLDVANIYKDDNLFIELSKPLKGSSSDDDSGGIKSVIPDPTDDADVSVKIAKKVVKHKAEFDGKFFVKIARDAVVDKKVREVGITSASFTVVNAIEQYYLTTPSYNSDEGHWEAVGEKWFIDEARRGKVGSNIWTNYFSYNYNGPYPRDNGFGIIGDESGVVTNLTPKRYGSSQPSLQCTMELTLNKIKDSNRDGYDISNNSSGNQEFLNKIKQKGTLFRWQEDPYQHVYRVVTAHSSEDHNIDGPPNHNYKKGILNYSSRKAEREDSDNKCIRVYLKFVTTGWRLSEPQGTAGVFQFDETEEGKYPFNYNNNYSTPPNASTAIEAWDPTKKGYGLYTAASGSSTYGDSLTSGNTWVTIAQNNSNPTTNGSGSEAFHNTMQIVTMDVGDEEPAFTKDPAVWETEPREDVGLDIYYEASQAYPTKLTEQTNELFAPYGCTVTCKDVINNESFHLPDDTVLWDWTPTGNGGNTLLLNAEIGQVGVINILGGITDIATDNTKLAYLNNNLLGLELQFTRPDGSYTTAKVQEYSAWDGANQNIDPTVSNYLDSLLYKVKITLDRNLTNSKIRLPYFNCYSFGNGVESDRIRDDFNAVTIGKGVKASTVLPELYKEEQRTNGLIYSGIYNSNSSLNSLNQFIGAEKITKDVPPTYGSIQKLKARDTNLVAFCEDKILKIQAYKDALYKADGNPDIISTNKVLGDISSFAGEFGISKNPESYAEDGFRMYCTDKQRGKVLRISGDGVTPISDVGMTDYFADNLKENDTLLGSFDDRKQEYNLTLKNNTPRSDSPDVTISFSEAAKGWTSFKSFIPENGLSINNNYYTFKNGELWQHHINETRNNFYGDDYNSHVDILFNEESATVKSFASMKYEGTQGKITENLGHTDANGVFYPDNEYYNNIGKPGWYVESGITDLQEAGEMEFKNKEGKWFSYMKGKSVVDAKDLDSKEFSFQGIDLLESIVDNGGGGGSVISGCTDPSATNYDPLATIDDGSCIIPTYGCTDPNAINYNPNADVDDLSCVVCSSLQINFDVDPHPMLHLSDGIRVISYLSADDLPYTVSCVNSSGILIGDSAGAGGYSIGSSSNGDIVYFGQGTPLPTDTYTITITTAHGCTSQETIFIDNGGTPPSSSFTITVQDIGDQDPGTNI